MNRGDVYWAELVPRSGSEQTGRRPVIILSHNAFNAIKAWRSIVVVPITTSASQTQKTPTLIALPAGEASLPRTSFAICHQVTTLDKSKLKQKIGALSPAGLDSVSEGVKAALDLD